MRKVLVTGGAGFIGSHLTEGLLQAGNDVVVLDDLSTGRESNLAAVRDRITLVKGSITDRQTVDQAVRGVEVVFHLAALPSVQRSVEAPLLSHEACASGTLNVLEAARLAGARRVVYAASSSAYGDTPGALRHETDAIAPLSPYAAAKLAGEHYCKAFTASYGFETVRLRFFNIFGPRQDPKNPYTGVIALFIDAMSQGKQPIIFGDGLQSRDFTYVLNATQAVMKAADAPRAVGKVYNIGVGGNVTLLDLIAGLNELLGKKLEPVFKEARAGDVRHSQADITAARADLGYEPTYSFMQGLKATLEAYQAGI
ncbi:MAG: SDR family oxidoreductase [Planctomycetia bacterium]|nr:SDR family oxidoreductase [Planctomycetia bacterium]